MGIKRKKLVVFFSRGGGGHLAASDAIASYFNGCYDITAVNPFDDILAHLDPIRKLSFGRFSGEDSYNFFMRHGWYRLINIYALKFGASYISTVASQLQSLLNNYLNREHPDLVISLIPLVNAPIAHATRNLGIPFAIVPVDLDPTTYLHGLNGSRYDHLYFAIPCDNADIRAKIISAGIPPEHIRVTGYPVRPAFLLPVEPKRVRESFGISHERPIIFLLMGANGTRRTVRFAQMIEKIDLPVELLIGIGRNTKLADRLARLPSVPQVNRRVIGFTSRIDELMGVADLLVTKSGPSTIFEALYRELPMVLDATTRVIRWEKMNISFVEENDLGAVIRRIEDLPHVIHKHLLDDTYRAKIQRNFAALDKRVFRDEFQALVKEITGE